MYNKSQMKHICECMLTVFFLFPVQIIFFYSISISRPSGLYLIRGLNDNCSINYDINGVPMIIANKNTSMAFAIGFAHASDRLWEMNLKRTLVQGRISEVFLIIKIA